MRILDRCELCRWYPLCKVEFRSNPYYVVFAFSCNRSELHIFCTFVGHGMSIFFANLASTRLYRLECVFRAPFGFTVFFNFRKLFCGCSSLETIFGNLHVVGDATLCAIFRITHHAGLLKTTWYQRTCWFCRTSSPTAYDYLEQDLGVCRTELKILSIVL